MVLYLFPRSHQHLGRPQMDHPRYQWECLVAAEGLYLKRRCNEIFDQQRVLKGEQYKHESKSS